MVHIKCPLLLSFNFGEKQTKIRRVQRVLDWLAAQEAAAASVILHPNTQNLIEAINSYCGSSLNSVKIMKTSKPPVSETG